MASNKVPEKIDDSDSYPASRKGSFLQTRQFRALGFAIAWVAATLLAAVAPYIIAGQQNKVYADSPPPNGFNWRNRQTIVGTDGSMWVDSDVTDGTQVFVRWNQKATKCNTDNLDVKTKQGATEATLQYFVPPAPTDSIQTCQGRSQTVTIGSKENYYLSYNWIDQGLIRHFKTVDLKRAPDGSDSKLVEKINELSAGDWKDFKLVGKVNGKDRYQQVTKSDCRSNIDVDPNVPTIGYFTYMVGDDIGNCQVYDYDGKIENIPIRLAQDDNYKLPNGSSPGNSNDGDAKSAESCETKNADRGFGWLMCGFLHILDDTIGWIDGQIQLYLIIPMDYFNDDGFRQAWGTIRNVALLVLVPIMLVMVIATALEMGPFDAYTVRKALPRFLIAVLFIVLSLPILKFLVQLSNVVETGILGLITSAFGNDVQNITLGSLFNPKSGESIAGIFGVIAAGGAGAAAIAGGYVTIGVVFSFALVALVGLLIGYIVLLVRILLVVGLVLLAPIAILPWIFPGNDKLWKMWKNTLTTLLMLGPILGAFIGVARMLAMLPATPWWLKIFFYVGVYFLILTFIKTFGGVLGTVMNGLNDKTRGFFDKQRKFRDKSREAAMHRAREGNRFKGGNANNWRGTWNRGIEYGMNLRNAGFNPTRVNSRMRTALNDATNMEAAKFEKENAAFGAFKGDDDKLWAARFTNRDQIEQELIRRSPRFQDAQVRGDAVEQIMRAQRETSHEAFARARVLAQASTGTGYQDPNTGRFNAGLVLRDINEAWGGDRNGATNALAQVRGALTNSGQVAGAAGFGTWAGQLEAQYQGGEAVERRAHETIMDDAITSASPGQALYGKPGSAAEFGAAHARRLQGLAESIRTSRPTVLRRDHNGNEIRGVATEEDLSAAMAAAAGIYDAMAQASPGNASQMAMELMGVRIDGIPIHVQNPDGTVEERNSATVREMIQSQMDSNPQFVNRRRDFQMAAAAEAARRAGGQGGPSASSQPPAGGQPDHFGRPGG